MSKHGGIDLKTDLVRMNEQHEQIFSKARNLLQELPAADSLVAWVDRYDELVVATERHFHTEERLMDLLDYRERLSHRELHNACLRELRQHGKNFRDGVLPDHSQLNEILCTWINHHLDHQDKRFHDFLEEQKEGADRSSSRVTESAQVEVCLIR